MAVINQYKFYGVTLTTTDEKTMFDAANTLPLVSETYVIRSLRVTNNTGNTPTITIKNKKTGEVYRTEEEWKAKGIEEKNIQRDVHVLMPKLDLLSKTK